MPEGEFTEAVKTFAEAKRFEALASTREDLAGVEESYWTAFNKLKGSPSAEHRITCAECLEAVARILDSEGRRAAADGLRMRAEAYRRGVPPQGEE